MMFTRQLTCVVSATVLAVHVLVGCCAHHDHNEFCAHDHSAHTCATHDHNHSAKPHHHHSDEADPASNHHHPRGCDGGQCVFLAGGKVSLPKLSIVNSISPATIEIAVNHPAIWTFGHDLLGTEDISPHLRTHLAKCVLRV